MLSVTDLCLSLIICARLILLSWKHRHPMSFQLDWHQMGYYQCFITNWVLEDVSDKIDTQQFGNIKCVSTSHYLVSLLNFLLSGADVINNVGIQFSSLTSQKHLTWLITLS